MIFEQSAITLQAIRGEQSHFNTSDTFGIVLFTLMGVFILAVTLWTAYITYVFIKQKEYKLNSDIVLGLKIGLVVFVLFSLFGGYISSLNGHTIGSVDCGEGLWILNWSTNYGDLRVAHFFGIHSLQIIPVFAIIISKFTQGLRAIVSIRLLSLIHLLFVLITLYQGLLGIPFMR